MKAAAGPIAFDGALDLRSVARLWAPTMKQAEAARGGPLTFDLSRVTLCDTAGATMLAAAETRHGEAAQLEGASPETLALIALVRKARTAQGTPSAPPRTSGLLRLWQGTLNGVSFLGEVLVGVVRAPARHRMFRPWDMLAYTDAAGTQAIPLILLLGFLMGLILAFQSSIPLRRFGAEIFVVNLVAISLIRELGPLLAAVVLAGPHRLGVRGRTRHHGCERRGRGRAHHGHRPHDNARPATRWRRPCWSCPGSPCCSNWQALQAWRR